MISFINIYYLHYVSLNVISYLNLQIHAESYTFLDPNKTSHTAACIKTHHTIFFPPVSIYANHFVISINVTHVYIDYTFTTKGGQRYKLCKVTLGISTLLDAYYVGQRPLSEVYLIFVVHILKLDLLQSSCKSDIIKLVMLYLLSWANLCTWTITQTQKPWLSNSIL